MKSRVIGSVLLVALALFMQGCSSHTMPITYQPSGSSQYTAQDAGVSGVSVTDNRGTASNWLGAIRGGYGNPLKKIYTDGDTASVVSDAFSSALEARSLLDVNESPYYLNVVLNKFDTSYYFNKEAHAHFTLSLVDESSSRSVFSKQYRTDLEEGGVGAGIFGNVESLSQFANEALNKNIDKALDDPEFISALQEPVPSAGDAFVAQAKERLEQLDDLKEEGLISEREYQDKRDQVLDNL